MNPLLLAALGSVLRWALAIAAGYLVRAGIWSQTDATRYVEALTTALVLAAVSLGWSFWQKYHARKTLMVALATPMKLSESEAVALAGGPQAPSVSTPTNRVPVAR